MKIKKWQTLYIYIYIYKDYKMIILPSFTKERGKKENKDRTGHLFQLFCFVFSCLTLSLSTPHLPCVHAFLVFLSPPTCDHLTIPTCDFLTPPLSVRHPSLPILSPGQVFLPPESTTCLFTSP